MKRKLKFGVGDTVEYKSGKRGFHYGFDNGNQYVVEGLRKPVELPNPHFYQGEWGGYLVRLTGSNMFVPSGWFKKV